MQDFKITPSEERQIHFDILDELNRVMRVLLNVYRKNPTEELEIRLKSLKESYLIYKKNNL